MAYRHLIGLIATDPLWASSWLSRELPSCILFFPIAMRPQCPTSKRKMMRTTISPYKTSAFLARVYGENGYPSCGHPSTSSVR